jgi:DNA-binding NtrC family response regulator
MTSDLRDAQILLVEDEQRWADILQGPLTRRRAKVDRVREKAEAVSRLYANEYDAVVLDSDLDGNRFAGVEILEMFRGAILPNGRFRPPMIMVTQVVDYDLGFRAQRAKVDEFLPKKDSEGYGDVVAAMVEKWVKRGRSERAIARHFVAVSPSMKAIYEQLQQEAASDQTVMLTGAPGVGKNALAQIIHRLHPRRQKKPFIKIECPDISKELFESEMFGTCKGAYNDAIDRQGKVKIADGGVLFLDEIAELTLEHQAKALAFIETREFWPVGAKKSDSTNVKIVVATNANLEERMKQGLFRSDLFYRLGGLRIHIPSLNERLEDIEPLADQYRLKANRERNKDVRGFQRDAISALRRYTWPGNVRELEFAIDRAVGNDLDHLIGLDDLPQQIAIPAGEPVAGRTGIDLAAKLSAFLEADSDAAAIYEVMKQMMSRGQKNHLMPKEESRKRTMLEAITHLRQRGEKVRTIAENLCVEPQTIRNAMKPRKGTTK